MGLIPIKALQKNEIVIIRQTGYKGQRASKQKNESKKLSSRQIIIIFIIKLFNVM